METPPKEISDALVRMHLLDGAAPTGEPLTGGVSSEIWRIDLPGGPICIKRALPKLLVTADWRAPVERNVYEARWMRVASQVVPHAVPLLLGQDAVTGALAMEYLPAERYPLWKALLRDEVVDIGFAVSVAITLGRIHAATAANPSLARDFPTDEIFFEIRLEPYLAQTGRAHPDFGRPNATADRDDATATSMHWFMATSARKTFCAARMARCSWMRNAHGGVIRPSIWHSA